MERYGIQRHLLSAGSHLTLLETCYVRRSC